MDGLGLPLPWGILPAEHLWRRVDVPNPAAGADWDAQVPGGVVWIVRGLRATLTGDGTGSTRRPYLSIGDGEAEVAVLAACATGGGVANVITVSASLGAYPGDDLGARIATCGLGPVVLLPRWTIGGRRQNGAGGDTWTAIRLWVSEWEVRGLERAAERYAEALREVA